MPALGRCFSYSVGGDKAPSDCRKEGFILSVRLRVQFSVVGKGWQQRPEVAAPTAPVIRKQRGIVGALLALSFPFSPGCKPKVLSILINSI